MSNREAHEADRRIFERVLAECIEAYSAADEGRIEALCRSHPQLAERLRERLASLQRLGFLNREADDTPQTLGRYTIQRRLGQGGMSVVYLARDERLDRRVALKTCHAFTEGDARVRERFEREIQAVAQLEHPSIVRIFDVGEADGRPFFTMEYVEGATLAQIVEVLRVRGDRSEDVTGASVRRAVEELVRDSGEAERETVDHPWPHTWVETICRWVIDVAGALAHAHAAGILHRDVKPSNIIVGQDGRARLFDLGLARFEGRPGLTRSGDFTGTPYYVSPEQLQGSSASIDQRSDIFSLGVTLYELLTFQRPFDGPSTASVFKQIVDRDPAPPRRHDPSLPVDLETICLSAIEKNPAARYQRMEDFAADLQRFLEFSPVKARPVGPLRQCLRFMRRKPALSVAAGLTLLILVGLPIGLLLANRAVSDQRDLATAHALEATRQAELSQHVTDFLVDLFQLTPEEIAREDSVTAREILGRGASRIPSGFEGQPLVRAALMRANGRVYHNLGLNAEALNLLDRAFAIFQRELGETHIETAGILHDLARVHLALGDPETSVGLSRRSLAGFQGAGLIAEPEVLQCLLTLAEGVSEPDDRENAQRHIAAALGRRRGNGYDESDLTADLLERQGLLHAKAGGFEAAKRSLRESVTLRRSSWVPNPVAIARGLEHLAAVHSQAGEAAQAERRQQEARLLRRSVLVDPLDALPRGEVSLGEIQSPFALRPPWQAEYDASFQAGITALQVGRYEDAAAAFERCLAWSPGQTICAYNLACSYALNDRIETSLDWVERAIDFGFGFLVDGAIVMRKDPDLDGLRSHPRWAALMSTMARRSKAAADYAAEPAIYRPSNLKPRTSHALLVVLHADGSTKDRVLNGPWREVADRLGLVLFAPSAATPMVGDLDGKLQAGMRWFRDLKDYVDRPWAYETPVIEDIRSFCRKYAVDRERVFIAGEGMGALLAVDIALSAPGLFRGALAINGPLHPPLAGVRTHVAASLGIALEVVMDERHPIAGRAPTQTLASLIAAVARAVPGWGLEGRVGLRQIDKSSGESPVTVRMEALSALQTRLSD